MVKSCEAVFVAKFAALGSRPRSPIMTVSGIAALGLSPDFIMRRIAAESVSPQLTAVLGLDTELQFAEIPVMRISILIFCLQRYKKISLPDHFKSEILLNDQRFFCPHSHV